MRIEPEAKTRRPKNRAEGLFYDAAVRDGWTVIKRGWPDFFLWRGDEYGVVEVKPDARKRLSRHQQRIAEVLAAHDIPIWRWDPERGFERIGEKNHSGGGDTNGRGGSQKHI